MVPLASIVKGIQAVLLMVSSIMMQELQTKINKKETLNIIDVREGFETAMGHIKGATLIPLSQIKKADDVLDKDKTYHIVCQSGGRSLQAAKKLSKKGYQVVNVMGGMGAYTGSLKR